MPRLSYRCALTLFICNLVSANAVTPEATSDARCFLAAVALSQSDNTAQVATAYYFLGRLDGREPGIDLEKLILEVSRSMPPSELGSEAQRCGHELISRGRLVSSIGRKLAHPNDVQSPR
jgi:hypothetical protein